MSHCFKAMSLVRILSLHGLLNMRDKLQSNTELALRFIKIAGFERLVGRELNN